MDNPSKRVRTKARKLDAFITAFSGDRQVMAYVHGDGISDEMFTDAGETHRLAASMAMIFLKCVRSLYRKDFGELTNRQLNVVKHELSKKAIASTADTTEFVLRNRAIIERAIQNLARLTIDQHHKKSHRVL